MLSNLLFALHTALTRTDYNAKYAQLQTLAGQMRAMMQRHGLASPVEQGQSDFMWTLQLPKTTCSQKLGDALAREGILVHHKNNYLLQRNWLQVSFMGCMAEAEAEMVSAIERLGAEAGKTK
jgi:hypothetical protein